MTPLWAVATFLTLTEVTLVYAVTQVGGGIQIALTTFVICFALLVFGAFFAILWNRPWVFYSPSEYGNINPKDFTSYTYEFDDGCAGSGSSGIGTREGSLEGTGLVVTTRGGSYLSLTDQGHRFAEWLIRNKRKARFFSTPFGGWGEPKPDGPYKHLRGNQPEPVTKENSTENTKNQLED